MESNSHHSRKLQCPLPKPSVVVFSARGFPRLRRRVGRRGNPLVLRRSTLYDSEQLVFVGRGLPGTLRSALPHPAQRCRGRHLAGAPRCHHGISPADGRRLRTRLCLPGRSRHGSRVRDVRSLDSAAVRPGCAVLPLSTRHATAHSSTIGRCFLPSGKDWWARVPHSGRRHSSRATRPLPKVVSVRLTCRWRRRAA